MKFKNANLALVSQYKIRRQKRRRNKCRSSPPSFKFTLAALQKRAL
ncbi:hypothetical protein CAMGR0001_0172 [Campylobacter gracilis RM3268]|uniref:Uncharacterized protein n=1 Tax=Campylobacter gracilis RM3268 TaxID=553220 RepID=C8PKF1_9BACT|nr:hypothetical protein CAMGR0001_0172 [Campylobacter gracilis RM3268]